MVYIIFEIARPKPINWAESYINTDKIPFGTFAIYDLMSDIFPNQKIESVRKPVYNQVSDLYAYNDSINDRYNYIFINDGFNIDTLDTKMLLSFAEAGNSVFIASTYSYTDTLSEKFGFNPGSEYQVSNDSVITNFTDKKLASKHGYIFRGWNSGNHFKIKNPKLIEILGKIGRAHV